MSVYARRVGVRHLAKNHSNEKEEVSFLSIGNKPTICQHCAGGALMFSILLMISVDAAETRKIISQRTNPMETKCIHSFYLNGRLPMPILYV